MHYKVGQGLQIDYMVDYKVWQGLQSVTRLQSVGVYSVSYLIK